MNDLERLTKMLDRIGQGYGTRNDHNPPGTAVMIEIGEDENAFDVTEFWFDAADNLESITAYPGEVG